MKKLLYAIDSLAIVSGKLFSFLTIIVVFVVVYEIIMRYLFHSPTIWASESMVFGCALVYVIGGAWTLYEKKHVKIDLVYSRLTYKNRVLMDLITFFFFALYIGMLTWASFIYAEESVKLRETSGSPWDPPIYPIKIALFLGVLLLLLQGISKFIKDLYFLIKGKEL